MSCQECSSGEKLVLHTRIVQIPGLFREIQIKYQANPYWEPEKHPILSREMSMGLSVLEKQIKQIPTDKYKVEVNYHINDNDDTQLNFYLELK